MSAQDISFKAEEGRLMLTDQFGQEVEFFMNPKHNGITIRRPGVIDDVNLSREQIMRVFPFLRAMFEVQEMMGKTHRQYFAGN